MAKLTWQLVDRYAETLGASPAARNKWRQRGRGVPPAWRIRLAEALKSSGHDVPFSEFDRLPENPGSISRAVA